MKRTRFFAPWSEVRAKLGGTNVDVIEALMYLFERGIATTMSLFAFSVVFFQSHSWGNIFLSVVSWLAALYLALLFVYLFFKPRQ